jgi:DNA-binding beta-propeller fold protein YncE
VTTIAVGSNPQAMCHNPVHNRVYVANYHSSSISVIRDSAANIEETSGSEAWAVAQLPTVAREVLRLPRHSTGGHAAELVNVAGRRVLGLHPGPNDVSRLAPGVHFVKEQGPKGQGARGSRVWKVVITR